MPRKRILFSLPYYRVIIYFFSFIKLTKTNIKYFCINNKKKYKLTFFMSIENKAYVYVLSTLSAIVIFQSKDRFNTRFPTTPRRG